PGNALKLHTGKIHCQAHDFVVAVADREDVLLVAVGLPQVLTRRLPLDWMTAQIPYSIDGEDRILVYRRASLTKERRQLEFGRLAASSGLIGPVNRLQFACGSLQILHSW